MADFKISAAQESVLLHLWEKGRDGKEHLAHMRGDEVLFESDGDDVAVRFPEGYTKNIKPGDAVLHNHPIVLNSFSNVDLYNGAHFGVTSFVITEDKSIYRADPLHPQESLIIDWELSNLLVGRIANMAYEEAGVLHSDDTTNERFATNSAHFTNLFLSKVGAIEYTYRLAEPTQKIIDAVTKVAKARIAAEAK